jgi:hypothetical protein
MAAIQCIETVGRSIGSVIGRTPPAGAGGFGVIMPTSPAVHL